MTPEGRLTSRVIRHLTSLRKDGEPIWWVKLHGGPQQRRGLPDLLIIYRGRHVFVELKAPGGELTWLQSQRIMEINAAGGEVAVCRTVEEFDLFLSGRLP